MASGASAADRTSLGSPELSFESAAETRGRWPPALPRRKRRGLGELPHKPRRATRESREVPSATGNRRPGRQAEERRSATNVQIDAALFNTGKLRDVN